MLQLIHSILNLLVLEPRVARAYDDVDAREYRLEDGAREYVFVSGGVGRFEHAEDE